MSDTVIRVENLSKKYIIGKNSTGSDGLRHAIHHFFTAPFKRFRNSQEDIRNPQAEEFWALKDVSFDLKQGEVLGIIGRNGAGKSTLLKILSRITEPTTGRLGIRGRVASLLEVGTGFHPELTGRENVFLNGAILGMSREEIKRKFDEIVAFAEVEKFLDTPVKRYSSGMYVRLAFAVAAHLEPEILIVDEVLAVGDAQFQKKCLGKMKEVGSEGRTVLFVSHNLAAVETLCTTVIRIHDGNLVAQGDVKEGIQNYVNSMQDASEIAFNEPVEIGPNLTLQKFGFLPNPIASGEEQEFSIELVGRQSDRIDSLVILFHSGLGQRVAIIDLRSAGCPFQMDDERLAITGRITSLPLVEGEYYVGLYIESRHVSANFAHLLKLRTVASPGQSDIVPYPANVRGFVELPFEAQLGPRVDTLQPIGDSVGTSK